MRVLVSFAIAVIVAMIFIAQTFFTVDETELVVVTRFGQIQRSISTPGLSVKGPFVDRVVRLDKRLLHIDVPRATMPDRDKQNLEIDAYVRYRIVEPIKYVQKLSNEFTASSRLGNIVISEIREEVARSERTSIIGGETLETLDEETQEVVRTVTLLNTRAEMLQRVTAKSDATVKSFENDFGVTIVDVRIKAADFPQATEESIFTRMRSEREVQAKRLRAEGEEESLKIRADVDRQIAVILAEAERDANKVRGEGEAEAISILAGALERDPEFFAFRRSLQAYQSILRSGATVLLSADSELFKYLQSSAPPE